ncbi:hypothetical protein L596_002025 [Steinernema carpocapsae]|nr:hypothetical protein L596_002025 [Steinernema carpocapsae]
MESNEATTSDQSNVHDKLPPKLEVIDEDRVLETSSSKVLSTSVTCESIKDAGGGGGSEIATSSQNIVSFSRGIFDSSASTGPTTAFGASTTTLGLASSAGSIAPAPPPPTTVPRNQLVVNGHGKTQLNSTPHFINGDSFRILTQRLGSSTDSSVQREIWQICTCGETDETATHAYVCLV